MVTLSHLSLSICNTYKIFKWYGLTFVGLEEAVFENGVTIIVNCYDVGWHTHKICKSDITYAIAYRNSLEFIY